MMNLGVVITNKANGAIALKLLMAASGRDWQLRCFLTDSGVQLFDHPEVLEYVKNGHWIAMCEMSLDRYQIAHDQVATTVPELIIGGQYQDAELVKNSDRVLVF
jgi:predicted peroxiredoxin